MKKRRTKEKPWMGSGKEDLQLKAFTNEKESCYSASALSRGKSLYFLGPSWDARQGWHSCINMKNQELTFVCTMACAVGGDVEKLRPRSSGQKLLSNSSPHYRPGSFSLRPPLLLQILSSKMKYFASCEPPAGVPSWRINSEAIKVASFAMASDVLCWLSGLWLSNPAVGAVFDGEGSKKLDKTSIISRV